MSAHYFNPQEMINKTIIFDEAKKALIRWPEPRFLLPKI